MSRLALVRRFVLPLKTGNPAFSNVYASITPSNTSPDSAANDMLNKGSFAYAGVALSGEVWDGVKGLLIFLKPTPR